MKANARKKAKMGVVVKLIHPATVKEIMASAEYYEHLEKKSEIVRMPTNFIPSRS